MRCLMVGGSGFLGGAMADAMVAAGHEVVVLSRSQTERKLPEFATAIRADRYGDLGVLKGQTFDWVFDSCAFSPGAVRQLLKVLGRVGRYVLISSISAYGTFTQPGLTEDAPVPDASAEDLEVARLVAADQRTSAAAYGRSYGPLKRACELAAADILGDRATALRVGLLVGAGDYTDRLTYWVRRIDEAHGARRAVVAPAPYERPVQLIDVRDVANFARRCAEQGLGGIWNVTGTPMPLGSLLDRVIAVARSQAELRWIPAAAIQAAGVLPWVDLPLMAPDQPQFRYFLEVGTGRAQAAGLTCRALEDTLTPLLAWDRAYRDRPLKCGLTSAQEALLLG